MASMSGAPVPAERWFKGRSPNQWRTFSGAYLGWMLDVMDLMIFSFVIRHVIIEFEGDLGIAGVIASGALVASAFGGVVFGLIADRIGRTKAMMLSILCYSVGAFLCGMAPNLEMLLIFRIIVGLGVGGEWSSGVALVSETWPARHRGKVLAWVQSAFATGYALAAVIVAIVVPLGGWRWAFFVGVLPAVLAFWIRRHTQESELWEKAERVSSREAFRRLFVNHRKPAIVCLLFTAAASCGYWGLFTWIPTFLATPVAEGGQGQTLLKSTIWIVVMQLGAGAGFVTFGYIADWLGRRKAFLMFFLGAVVMVPLFVTVKGDVPLLVLGAVMSYLGTGFYSGFGPTFAELFPTEIRAFAQGVIYNTGRGISAFAPAIVGFMSLTFGPAMALASTAGFYLLAAVVVFFFLPETKGRDLEAVDANTGAETGRALPAAGPTSLG